MKTIEVDDELYRYIASHTLHIGESASDILRRMLKFSAVSQPATPVSKAAPTLAPAPVAEVKPANPVKIKSAPCARCCYLMNTPSRSAR